MKILHISTLDHGGAAKACLRLHKGLLDQGIDSSILFREQTDKTIPYTYLYKKKEVTTKPSFGKRLTTFGKSVVDAIIDKPSSTVLTHQDRLKNQSPEFEIFSPPYSKYDLNSQPIYQEADIINLHWVTYFLDYERFFPNTDKKIVWTFHDMNAFTGGCHYSGTCEKFTGSCEVCPQLVGTGHETYSHKLFLIKARALQNSQLTIVSPSRWMYDNAQKSTLLKNFNHHTIPNSANHYHFQPLDKIHSRIQLNLPLNKKILLFVADNMNKTRKGFGLLAQALSQIEQTDIALCTVGSSQELSLGTIPVIYLGKITDEPLMAAVYSAADVFIAPSLQDNLPNTLIESILCGTPAIAFPIGGIPDIIDHGKNGILCDSVTIESLQTSIKQFLDEKYSFDKQIIRNDAVARFATLKQASAYASLYKKILNENE